MKALKILVSIVGVLAVLFVVAVVVIFSMLPSPGQIGKAMLQPTRIEKPSKNSETPSTPAVTATVTLPKESDPVAEENRRKGTVSMNSAEGQIIFRDLMDERKPLTEFCSLLGRPSTAARTLKPEELGEILLDHFTKGPSDPAMEAFMPFMRQFFRYDETRDLFKMIDEAQREGDQGFLQKAQFYAGVAKAYAKVSGSKAEFDRIGDRTYHLLMIARIADRHPELARDRAVGDYCRQIQGALNEQKPFGDEERKAFQDFLSQSGVSAKEIGYDPNYRTNIEFSRKDGGLNFHGGWLDSWVETKPKTQEVR